MSWRTEYNAGPTYYRVEEGDYERMKAAERTVPSLRESIRQLTEEVVDAKAKLAALEAEKAGNQSKIDRLPIIARKHAGLKAENEALKALLAEKGIDFSHLVKDESSKVATPVSDSGTAGSGAGAGSGAAAGSGLDISNNPLFT